MTAVEKEMLENKINLLAEDLEVVHMYLDSKFILREDDKGRKYSIIGRIKRLEEKYQEQRERDFSAGNDSACMEHEDIKDYFDKYIKSAKEAYEFGQKTMYCGCYAIEDAITYEEWVSKESKSE